MVFCNQLVVGIGAEGNPEHYLNSENLPERLGFESFQAIESEGVGLGTLSPDGAVVSWGVIASTGFGLKGEPYKHFVETVVEDANSLPYEASGVGTLLRASWTIPTLYSVLAGKGGKEDSFQKKQKNFEFDNINVVPRQKLIDDLIDENDSFKEKKALSMMVDKIIEIRKSTQAGITDFVTLSNQIDEYFQDKVDNQVFDTLMSRVQSLSDQYSFLGLTMAGIIEGTETPVIESNKRSRPTRQRSSDFLKSFGNTKNVGYSNLIQTQETKNSLSNNRKDPKRNRNKPSVH